MDEQPCPKCGKDVPVPYDAPLEIKCPHCAAELWCYWDEDAGGDAWRGLELNE